VDISFYLRFITKIPSRRDTHHKVLNALRLALQTVTGNAHYFLPQPMAYQRK